MLAFTLPDSWRPEKRVADPATFADDFGNEDKFVRAGEITVE